MKKKGTGTFVSCGVDIEPIEWLWTGRGSSIRVADPINKIEKEEIASRVLIWPTIKIYNYMYM